MGLERKLSAYIVLLPVIGSPLMQEICLNLSLQVGFSLVRAAVACPILERISGVEPWTETTALRYLKLVTLPCFCPFTLIFHQFGFLSIDLHRIPCVCRALDLRNLGPKFGPIPNAKKYVFFPIQDEIFPI